MCWKNQEPPDINPKPCEGKSGIQDQGSPVISTLFFPSTFMRVAKCRNCCTSSLKRPCLDPKKIIPGLHGSIETSLHEEQPSLTCRSSWSITEMLWFHKSWSKKEIWLQESIRKIRSQRKKIPPSNSSKDPKAFPVRVPTENQKALNEFPGI